MKKLLVLLILTSSMALFSCGNGEKKTDDAAAKMKADSTRAADSIAKAKAVDSAVKAKAMDTTFKKNKSDSVIKSEDKMEEAPIHGDDGPRKHDGKNGTGPQPPKP